MGVSTPIAAAASGLSLMLAGTVAGTAWLGVTVPVPVGWLIIGPLALLFTPALAIVTAISRRLGIEVDVENK